MKITFMQSETKSEAASGTWETHIFQFTLPHGSLRDPLELFRKLKNLVPQKHTVEAQCVFGRVTSWTYQSLFL